jgi:hypothetical protein
VSLLFFSLSKQIPSQTWRGERGREKERERERERLERNKLIMKFPLKRFTNK